MNYRLIKQSTGWLYLILVPLLHITYRLIFRKIHVYRRKSVPSDKPVIIASNHPTAFMDPILYTMFLDPPVYNMTRGDIFEKPFFRKLLADMNMFPIFRKRDGYNQVDRNDEVSEYCQQKMLQKRTVCVFVEGEHHADKRVLPIQKGLARIAFATYENHKIEDLQIIPAGCNYVFGDRTRDEVVVMIGDPIYVKDYWPMYVENPALAINQFNKKISESLKKICYHVNQPENDHFANQMLELYRTDHYGSLLPVVEHNAGRFWEERALLERINNMEPSEKEGLKTMTDIYFSSLGDRGLSDLALMHPEHSSFIWVIFLMLAAVPALLASILSWPIRKLSRYVAGKAAKKKEFYTSILLGIATLSGAITALVLLIVGIFMALPWLISTALLLPLCAWISIFYREMATRFRSSYKAQKHPDQKFLREIRDQVTGFL